MGLSSPVLLAPLAWVVVPKPETRTLIKVRFIALHMMTVRMRPEAPTRQPATTSTLLLMTKPAAQAARPEQEFSSEMTTGISPPPMGITAKMPSKRESINTIMRTACASSVVGEELNSIPAAMMPRASSALKAFCPVKVRARPPSLPESLPHA